jgi:hypothetical protein
MHLHRQHVLAAVLLAGIGGIASITYLASPGAPPPPPGTNNPVASLNPSAMAPSGLLATHANAEQKLADDSACDFEPLKKQAQSLREDASDLRRRARNFADRLGLHDADLEAAAAEVTVPADPQAIAKMRADMARHTAALDRWMAEAGPVLDHNFDAFMDDLEKRAPALMTTTIPVEYRDAKKAEEQLRADGVPATDPRRKSAQASMQLYRDQLLRYGSGINDINFDETRYVVEHLENSAATIAEYQTTKTQYLTAKAAAADMQQRYEAARLVPLPPQRTKDWRRPLSNSR